MMKLRAHQQDDPQPDQPTRRPRRGPLPVGFRRDLPILQLLVAALVCQANATFLPIQLNEHDGARPDELMEIRTIDQPRMIRAVQRDPRRVISFSVMDETGFLVALPAGLR
jgi:hypothetical protein